MHAAVALARPPTFASARGVHRRAPSARRVSSATRGLASKVRVATAFAPPRVSRSSERAGTRATAEPTTAAEIAKQKVIEIQEEIASDAPGFLKRAGLVLVAAGAVVAALAASFAPLQYTGLFVVDAAWNAAAAPALSESAKLGVSTLVRLLGAANLIVATAAASLIPAEAPKRMRRVVESVMLVYGLCVVAVAFLAQRGGLWSVPGKWIAHSYGGFLVAFFATCLFSENVKPRADAA
jgi:hypothetical protein